MDTTWVGVRQTFPFLRQIQSRLFERAKPLLAGHRCWTKYASLAGKYFPTFSTVSWPESSKEAFVVA
jgi:hypothetical protein